MSKEVLDIIDGVFTLIKDGEVIELGRPIFIKEHRTNIDTSSVKIFLGFEYQSKLITKLISRKDLKKRGLIPLTEYGADCWDDVEEYYVDYLRNTLEKAKKTYEHSSVGWGTFEGERIFKLYNGIGIDSIYDEGKYDIKPVGTHEGWMKTYNEEVRGRRWLEFSTAGGLTAPLISLFSNKIQIESLLINFCGRSSTGKTQASKLAVSLWGRPDTTGNGLIKHWYGTDQGLLSHLNGNFGIPIVIDDTSLQEGDKDYTQMVYLMVGGKGKAGLNTNGSNRKEGEWATTIISSSEVSIKDNTDPTKSGIDVRLIEVKSDKLTDSAENAERIEQGIQENYGHAGRIYMEHLMKYEVDELINRWEIIKQQLLSKMREDGLSRRIVGKLALVRLAGELANESLELGIDLEVLDDTLVEIENSSLKKRDVGGNAYDDFIQYFMSNKGKFFRDKREYETKRREVVGKYTQDANGITEIMMPTSKFREVIKKLGYQEEQVLSEWKKKDLLNHDKKKNTLTRVYVPGMPRQAMYAVKVIEKMDAIETTEIAEPQKLTLAPKPIKMVAEEQEKYTTQTDTTQPKKKKLILKKVNTDEDSEELDEVI